MDNTKPKRLRFNTLSVTPEFECKTTKTELFREKTGGCQTLREEPLSSRPNDVQPPELPIDLGVNEQVTEHQRRTLQECMAWENCRNELIEAHFETQFINNGQLCIQCNTPIALDENHIRCNDCSLHSIFCSIECLKKSHNGQQIALHKPQVWKSDERKYRFISIDVQFCRRYHHCTRQYLRSGIQAFDHQGRLHTISIMVCPCEKNATTFLRHQLWASSVESPSVCFHIELLKWMQYLVLEARASVASICQSLRWKNNLTAHQFNTLYRGVIGECFEQFRHFQYKLQNMDLLDDTKCPACPKESGSVFISLDANFGLVRKQNSGTSLIQPKHVGKIFVEKSVQKSLNTNKDEPVNKDTVCNHFQAGNNLRSKNKAAKLDVTGVFGSCCRHGVPHTFINLDRGERLCYSIHVINKLLDEVAGTNIKLHILYDIACMLHRHLQTKHDPDRYKDVTFAVPIFHAYAHKVSCQVGYSTRWLPGFGLTDGEEMERIWAYLRRFSIITKEMTPSHRIDLLTDALLHYKKKKITDLDLTLAKAMEKAQCVIAGTSRELEAACRDLSISTRKVEEWIQQDKENFNQTSIVEEPISAEEKYVQTLLLRSNIIDTYTQCNEVEDQNKLKKQHSKLTEEVEKMERSMRIRTTWQPTDGKFIKYRKSLDEKKKSYLLKNIHKQAQEYKFTKNLREKYCDGHALAERLSKNMTRVTKRIRKGIAEYNNSAWGAYGVLPSIINWVDASNPLAEMYTKVYDSNEMMNDEEICFSERQRIVDLCNRNSRAKEEIKLTTEEMQTTLLCMEEQYHIIIQSIQRNTTKGIGLIIALQGKATDARERYMRASSMFSGYISVPPVPANIACTTELELITDSILNDEMHITEMENFDDDDDDDGMLDDV